MKIGVHPAHYLYELIELTNGLWLCHIYPGVMYTTGISFLKRTHRLGVTGGQSYCHTTGGQCLGYRQTHA